MPTRKQRRRRAKDRRHEYEFVFVDDEGNEVEVDPDEPPQPSRNGRARQQPARSAVRVQAPSWRRVGRRGLIFAPLMFLTVMFIDSSLELWQVAVQTVWLLAIFLPFSYFMDSFMYRRYRRRTEAPAPKR